MSLRAKGSLWLAAVLVGALLLGASAGALAQQCAAPAAKVISIQGSLELRPHNAKQWQAAQTGIPICSGDSVRVGPRSRAALLLPNETTLRLDQGTTLTLSAPDQAQASLLDLILGTIHVISRTPKPFRVNTPYLNAGVEGTEFLVGSSETSARLAVFEGRVSATSADSSLMLVGGEIAYAAKGVPLRKERMLRPADAVQWALYYPTLFDHRLGEQIAGTPGEAALRESIALYRQDRLAEAIFRLDKAPEGLANPRFLTYRAGLLLLVGRADEAGSDIERALAVDAGNSNAHALKSVVALTQNDKDQALKLAIQAVELDQASPVARLALSYAQQAHFKIDEALASVQKAVDLDPQNALAWARLAELHMSTGYLDRALEAAKRAASLGPEVAKTQSVLGFANLTRIDTQAAKQAFQKAIDLDQADPLPRLGLGLAMIREGELTAGREQLEIAVCLDPENSLLRSYVGKAYYEEKRDKLAGIQFDLAKERDPRDPTPWFYDAIRKQTENRPVEALGDLEKSIDLNGNRAVYRSQLMMDRDLAARSARLGQIYRDLGFEQLALVEGWRSLERDPSNYSAHRLLADSYLVLPRHEIARDSELLQSLLLQPLTNSPVQPQLATSGIGLFQDAGLLPVSPNEYSELFEENRTRLHISGIYGNMGTSADNLILSGLHKTWSYSLGHFLSRTDGFRENNDQRNEIVNAFLQAAVSSRTSVQAEIRRAERESGDRFTSFFDTDNFSGTAREALVERTTRLGFRHALDARNTFVGSYIHQVLDDSFPGGVARQNGNFFEIRHLYQSESNSFSSGLSYLKGTQNDTNLQAVMPNETRSDLTHTTVYIYDNWHLIPSFSLNLGASFDSFSSPQVDRKQINPKLGATWVVRTDTSIRAAAFRTVKRGVITSQTVEPTQIAGFNQFFDDINGTSTWRYGLAVDQKASAQFFWGTEASLRNRSLPARKASVDRSDVKFAETFGRAYLLWLPTPTVAISADYLLERVKGDPGVLDPNGVNRSTTHRLPLQLRYFAPFGLTLRVGATYIRQEGQFANDARRAILLGSDDFWVVDTSFGYRLPHRRGVLSIEVKNLFNRQFHFQDSEPDNSIVARARVVLARLAIEF